MRLIDADAIPYTMLFKENWLKGTAQEAQAAWKSDIDNMPSVQLKRKTGRWIDAQYPFSKCDKCGAYMDTESNEANYCCVCGAKMEVEHD